jgi:sec-independent protein translocase protein TatA
VIPGEIIGPDLLIVFLVFALLFGSSQLPKLARSIGQASKEFRQGLAEGADPNDGSGHSPTQLGGPAS